MYDKTFETHPVDLSALLRDVEKGRLQLPDFQRDYVWGDEDVQNLIGSVAKGYPIGTFLSLQTGGEVNFRPRLLAGVPADTSKVEPVELLLDGQQRLTSLYQALYSPDPAITLTSAEKTVKRYYYLNIETALSADADLRNAIVGVPADRVLRENFGQEIKKDLSSCEKQFQEHAFPLNLVFSDRQDWLYKYQDYWQNQGDTDVSSRRRDFDRKILERINKYEVPMIRLDREIGREAICLVFEKVNTGGKPLNTFQLLTAVYARDGYDLRSSWNQLRKSLNQFPVLRKVENTDFLQACALLYTYENNLPVNCNRGTLLKLPLESYKACHRDIETGFKEAAALLNEQKVIDEKDRPYTPLIIGLAAIFAILRREGRVVSAPDRIKIGRWFWSMTLSETYRARTDSLLASDVPELVRWISGDSQERPRTMDAAIFQQGRIRSLSKRTSAAYKGIHALLMSNGCKDFVTGKPIDIMTFFEDAIDIHHIFPKAWCAKAENQVSQSDMESIVNKTPLSKKSNACVGSLPPSEYLKRIEKKYKISPDMLDDILRTHLIEPEHLRNDDFKAFFQARIDAITRLIGQAMGKPVAKEEGSNEEESDARETEDDEDGVVEVTLSNLIRQGESSTMEFKSTLRKNLHTGKNDPQMTEEVLQTLAALLNTEGGMLIIGIADDRTAIGIEQDGFKGEDHMKRHLMDIATSKLISTNKLPIDPRCADYEDNRVLIVHCGRSRQPVYLKINNTEKFYVRNASSTVELPASQLANYIQDRFNQV